MTFSRKDRWEHNVNTFALEENNIFLIFQHITVPLLNQDSQYSQRWIVNAAHGLVIFIWCNKLCNRQPLASRGSRNCQISEDELPHQDIGGCLHKLPRGCHDGKQEPPHLPVDICPVLSGSLVQLVLYLKLGQN